MGSLASAVRPVLPILVALGLAACGGSSPHSTTASAPKSSGGTSAHAGAVHATLTGQNHAPAAGHNWKYTVTVTDAHGHPLSGSAATEFAIQGNVVGRETPPTHSIKHGRLEDVLQFPAQSAGYPIELQVVVHTRLGSVKLDWPVSVKK